MIPKAETSRKVRTGPPMTVRRSMIDIIGEQGPDKNAVGAFYKSPESHGTALEFYELVMWAGKKKKKKKEKGKGGSNILFDIVVQASGFRQNIGAIMLSSSKRNGEWTAQPDKRPLEIRTLRGKGNWGFCKLLIGPSFRHPPKKKSLALMRAPPKWSKPNCLACPEANNWEWLNTRGREGVKCDAKMCGILRKRKPIVKKKSNIEKPDDENEGRKKGKKEATCW